MKYKALRLFFIFVFVISCQDNKHSFSNSDDLEIYLNDESNGFIQKDESKDFTVETKLIPSFSSDNKKQLNVQMRLTRNDGLNVLETNNASSQEISGREVYLSFQIINDVFFQNGSDEIRPIFSHFERNYGTKQSVDLYFTFDYFIPKESIYFVYRDKLFDQGLYKIRYKKELFRTIKLNEK